VSKVCPKTDRRSGTRKPVNFIHPNGIRRIKSISFGTREELIPIIRELCNDPVLTLFMGRGIKDLEFEYAVREL